MAVTAQNFEGEDWGKSYCGWFGDGVDDKLPGGEWYSDFAKLGASIEGKYAPDDCSDNIDVGVVDVLFGEGASETTS